MFCSIMLRSEPEGQSRKVREKIEIGPHLSTCVTSTPAKAMLRRHVDGSIPQPQLSAHFGLHSVRGVKFPARTQSLTTRQLPRTRARFHRQDVAENAFRVFPEADGAGGPGCGR